GYTDHSKTLPLALIPGKILPFLNFVDLLQVELTCLDFFNLINSEQYCHVIWNSLIGVGTMSKAEAAKRRQLISSKQYPFAPIRDNKNTQTKQTDGVYASCLAVMRRLSKCAERQHRVQLVDVTNLAFWTPLTLARLIQDLNRSSSTVHEFLPLNIRAHPLHIVPDARGHECNEIMATLAQKLTDYSLCMSLATEQVVSCELDPQIVKLMFRHWYSRRTRSEGERLHNAQKKRLVHGAWVSR